MSKGSRFIWQSTLPFPIERVFAWHTREGAFQRFNPPWRPVAVTRGPSNGIKQGSEVSIRLPVIGRFGLPWDICHGEYRENELFVDEQKRGPFRVWRHEHRFHVEEPQKTTMVDSLQYELPLLGKLVEPFFRRELRRLFSHRHAVLLHDLTLHERVAHEARKTVLISGASGFIGQSVSAFLSTGGHTVRKLVRRAPRDASERFWDPYKGEIDPHALEGVDVVLHLSGENVASGRWTEKRKDAIRKSREITTKFLVDSICSAKLPPAVAIIASGVGFYGASEELKDESALRGSGFIASVSSAWEEASRALQEDGRCRVVCLRAGAVLNARGGALKKMLPAFVAGLGGPLGSGAQWMSWIALEDLLGLVQHIIYTPSISGPVNAVSPHPCTNREFTRALARVLRRPAWFKIPRFVIHALFGEMGEELLLSSSRVMPKVAMDSGYTFLLADLREALLFETGNS